MARKEHQECFYCGALCSGRIEMDHFPLPKHLGGKFTVPSCVSCHDMKDRFRLDDWSSSWWLTFVDDFPKLSRESRLVLAKLLRVMLPYLRKQLAPS